MKLLKSFRQHGSEIKIFAVWENEMRVVIRNLENAWISFTCPFDSSLEESDQVKNFLTEYFRKRELAD